MKTKKIVLIFALLSVALFSVCLSACGKEEDKTMKNFIYTATAETCVITGIKDNSVKQITVPDFVTKIADGAFSSCSNLEEITIPFVGAVAGKTANDTYQYPFGYIFGTDSYTGSNAVKQLYYGDIMRENTTYYIPNSLRKVTVTGGNILYGAFSGCSSISNIIISDNITSIGAGAFFNCSSLTNITIPESVTNIYDAAFSDCTSLTSIIIPDSVTNIGDEAFSNCSSLTSITIPDSITNIGYGVFRNCSNLSNIIIPDSVTNIGDEAFSGCSSLTSVSIGNSVTSIGADAFSDCTSLTSIIIPDSVTNIGSGAFSGCNLLQYNLLDNIKYLGNKSNPYVIVMEVTDKNLTNCLINNKAKIIYNNAFSDCTNLTSVIIPDSVTNISDSAFSGCSSLSSVSIGNSVTNINSNAFSDCTCLTSIIIPDSVTSIGNGAFEDCRSLTSVTIPNSVTSIGFSAFIGCSKLTSVTIGNSLTSIGNYAFYNTAYYNDENNWENGVLYIGKHLIKAKTDLSGAYTIKDGTLTIADSAFIGCRSLSSITIPDSVTSIGSSAFEDCSSLTSITIPNSVTSIGSYAFYNTGYYNDENNWENGVLYIDKHLIQVIYYFSGEYTIKDETLTIADYAFQGRGRLTRITIPDSVTRIGDSAFSNCYSLRGVAIGKGVTSIGSYAFSDCYSLASVTFENTNGWYICSSGSATSGTNIDVTDTARNATYLTSTYCNYYWKRG